MNIKINYEIRDIVELERLMAALKDRSAKESQFFQTLSMAVSDYLELEPQASNIVSKMNEYSIKTLLKYGKLNAGVRTLILNTLFDKIDYTRGLNKHLEYIESPKKEYNDFFSKRKNELKYTCYVDLYLAYRGLICNNIKLDYFPNIKKHEDFILAVQDGIYYIPAKEEVGLILGDLTNRTYHGYYEKTEISEKKLEKIAFNFFKLLKNISQNNPGSIKAEGKTLAGYLNKIFNNRWRGKHVSPFAAQQNREDEDILGDVLYSVENKEFKVKDVAGILRAFDIESLKESMPYLEFNPGGRDKDKFLQIKEKMIIEACLGKAGNNNKNKI